MQNRSNRSNNNSAPLKLPNGQAFGVALAITYLFISYLVVALLSQASPAQDRFVLPESRLQSLTIEKPEDFRDLAEELAVIEGSDAAKNMAVRLYLICAANSEGKLRRSALRGLVQAGRSQQERQTFKVLAYLQDPQFSDLLLTVNQQEGKTNPQTTQEDAMVKAKLLDALLSIRQGKYPRAKKIMEDQAVQQLFTRLKPGMTITQFNQACQSKMLSDLALLQVMELDAKLRSTGKIESVQETPAKIISAWRQRFKAQLPNRLPKIGFDSVTEFDPTKSVYRNGIWRSPAK